VCQAFGLRHMHDSPSLRPPEGSPPACVAYATLSMQSALLSIVMRVVMIGNRMDGLNAYAPILLLLKPAALESATLSLRRL